MKFKRYFTHNEASNDLRRGGLTCDMVMDEARYRLIGRLTADKSNHTYRLDGRPVTIFEIIKAAEKLGPPIEMSRHLRERIYID